MIFCFHWIPMTLPSRFPWSKLHRRRVLPAPSAFFQYWFAIASSLIFQTAYRAPGQLLVDMELFYQSWNSAMSDFLVFLVCQDKSSLKLESVGFQFEAVLEGRMARLRDQNPTLLLRNCWQSGTFFELAVISFGPNPTRISAPFPRFCAIWCTIELWNNCTNTAVLYRNNDSLKNRHLFLSENQLH